MSKPEPARFRTTNWKSYNEALKQRGSLLIWLDKETWCGEPRRLVAPAVQKCSPMLRCNAA